MSNINVLVVCTANRCRSPIGEVLLADALQRAGADAAVSSAGLLTGGRQAEAEGIEAVRQEGLDLSQHVSRQLTNEIAAEADLILTMERMHVREIAVRHGVIDKTFTVKDFARRAAQFPRFTDESMQQWVQRLAETRKRTDVLGSSPEDEVVDPIGEPLEAFVRTRDELNEVMAAVVAGLVPNKLA